MVLIWASSGDNKETGHVWGTKRIRVAVCQWVSWYRYPMPSQVSKYWKLSTPFQVEHSKLTYYEIGAIEDYGEINNILKLTLGPDCLESQL